MQLPYEGRFEQFAQLLCLRKYLDVGYAMIGSYLDESADPKQLGIFAVGGILGRCRPIFELDRKWEQLRQRPDINIEYFKASECQRGSKQFSKFVADPKNITPEERARLDEVWSQFLDVLIGDPDEHVVIFGIGVVLDDFYEVIKNPVAKSILGESPYWFAYQAAMIEAAFAMKKVGQGDSVAIICDKDEEHSTDAPKVYCDLKDKNPNAAEYMGPFGMDEDHLSHPLQAADAVIYEIRRSLHVSLARWKESQHFDKQIRWQFNKLADAKRIWLIQYAHKENLEEAVKENTPGQPLNLDSLMEQEFDKDVQF